MKWKAYTLNYFLGCIVLFTASAGQGYAFYSAAVIKEVTVYRQYARITQEVLCNVSAGTSEQIITGITESVIPSSLQVAVNGNATLLSAVYRHNYLNEQIKNEEIQALRDSVRLIEYEIKHTEERKAVYKSEEQLLSANIKLGSAEQGVSVAELKLLADYFRTRMFEIRSATVELVKKTERLQQQKARLENQLNTLNARESRPTGEIAVTLSAFNPASVKIIFSYLTTRAGWIPVYDIRSSGNNKPVTLVYKADVQQNTGYDWKQVKLILSTGDPSADNNRPILYPLYVDFFQPAVMMKSDDVTLEKAAAPRMMESMAAQAEAEAEAGPEYVVTEHHGQVTDEYHIELSQTIPSDGAYHRVPVKEYSLPAQYRYQAVPRLNNGAFLLASITNYGQYNLLPGNANIFSDEMYVGQSLIDPLTGGDTLLISLGRDDKVAVRLQQLKDFTEKKLIGTHIRETKGFEINLRNNRGVPVEIEIFDQVPVSRNKDIVVELTDDGGAFYNKDTGILLWRIQVPASQSHKIRFTYSVRYPRGTTIDYHH